MFSHSSSDRGLSVNPYLSIINLKFHLFPTEADTCNLDQFSHSARTSLITAYSRKSCFNEITHNSMVFEPTFRNNSNTVEVTVILKYHLHVRFHEKLEKTASSWKFMVKGNNGIK